MMMPTPSSTARKGGEIFIIFTGLQTKPDRIPTPSILSLQSLGVAVSVKAEKYQ
jgi:hypothetical protein